MSRVLGLAVVCGVLAVVQAVAVALGLTLLLVLLLTAVRHPRETFGFLAALGLLALVSAQPVPCLVALTVIAVVAVGTKGKARGQQLLPKAVNTTEPRDERGTVS